MNRKASILEKYNTSQHSHRVLNNAGEDGSIGIGFLAHATGGDYRGAFPKYGALLLLRGSGKYSDDRGNQCEISAGAFIQRLPDRWHETTVKQDGQWLECHITTGMPLYESLNIMGVIDTSRPVLWPGNEQIMAEAFYQLLYRMRKANDDDLPFFVPEIISLIAELTWKHSDKSNHKSYEYEQEIKEAAQFLSKNISQPISLEKDFKKLPLSYERFRKLFRQHMGVSPGEYRIRKKLERAVELLHDSSMRIYQISRQLGYADAFTFSKQFTRFTGKSPTRYRNDVIGISK